MGLPDQLRLNGGDVIHVPPVYVEPITAVLGEDDITLTNMLHCMFETVIEIDETAGAGSYNAAIPVPAGWYLIDILVAPHVAWTNAGNALMKIGNDADDNGFYSDINLKTLATSISYAKRESPGAFGGTPKQFTSAGSVIISVTTTGAGGGAGYTLVLVKLSHRVMSAEKS